MTFSTRLIRTLILITILCLPAMARAEDRIFLTHIPVKVDATTIQSAPEHQVKGETIVFRASGTGTLVDAAGNETRFRVIPALLSILPPLVAILFALLFRQVILSLLMGVWLGVFIGNGYNLLPSVLSSLSDTIPAAIADKDHISIIVFSLLLGGMVGIISANGGTSAIVRAVTPRIRNRRGVQVSCWFLGCAIFFDDYANTLIVGNTMRPLTDRYRLSREKLAFFVDSTAAPVASIAIISTWIGFEVGVLNDVFATRGMELDGYSAFIYSIPYLFYPIFTLIFGFLLAISGRDFGPMLRAERKAATATDGPAKTSGTMDVQIASPSSAWMAFVPILTVVVVTLWGIFHTGFSGNWSLREIFSGSDSFAALIWGSAAGCAMAGILSVATRRLTVSATLEYWVEGLKSMMMAVIILCLAWSLSSICSQLHTADFILSLVSTRVPFWLIPLLTFVVAAAMSFATGTSWGTMAITYPLLVPVVIGSPFLYPTVAAVLSGAVFGDHCSPISDTTIMSSMASACDHVEHVRTQIPYALTTGGVSIVLGYLLMKFQLSVWILYPLGGIALWMILRFVGKPGPQPEPLPEK